MYMSKSVIIDKSFHNDGLIPDFWYFGTTLFGLALLIVGIKLVTIINTWNLALLICFLFSYLTYICTLLIIDVDI